MSFDLSKAYTILMERNKALMAIIGLLAFTTYKIIDRRNQSGRPPLLQYTIPWLGSAIELGKDPDSVFKKATAMFGPVFRVKAAGKEFTYITAADIISSIYRDTKTFEYVPIRIEMAHIIFGLPKYLCDDMPSMEHIFKVHHDGLNPAGALKIHRRYGSFAYECIQSTLDNLPSTTKLSCLIKPPAYDAALYAFFGKTFPAPESYESFKTFDEGFIMLQMNLPRFMLRKYLNAREKLIDLTENYFGNPHEECSEFARDVEEAGKNAKWSLRDIANFFLGDIWALQSNAIQAAYWIIALQLQRPEGLGRIIEEIDMQRNSWIENNPNTDIQDETHCQWILDGSFPLLTSVIQEALRYCAVVFSIRLVARETTLGGYRLQKGESVICNTRSVHMDGDIHNNPTEFIPERYLPGAGKYTKNGRTVPNHSMPFGGGVSMCEGRHFAIGELKIFIALLLLIVNIELDPSSSERPQFNWAHMGTGLLPPIGDLSVRVTRRSARIKPAHVVNTT